MAFCCDMASLFSISKYRADCGATSKTEMSESRWYAAYTRSQHEARVAEHLAARSVEFFLAQYKQISRRKDGRLEISLPLFPCYIFVRLPAEERLRVLEAPGVIYLVSFSGRPEPLPDLDIAKLKASTVKELDPKPHPYIAIGERVLVIRGPLEGTQGIFIREKNKQRVVLSLDLIQRSMSVEMDVESVMPVQSGSIKPIISAYQAKSSTGVSAIPAKA